MEGDEVIQRCSVCVGWFRQGPKSALWCLAWLGRYEIQLSSCCNLAEFPLRPDITLNHGGNHDLLTAR